MKMDKRLMAEVEELWPDHEEALSHFGWLCVAAAKAGHEYKLRKRLRQCMVIATAATIVVTKYLDQISEVY